jgi:hypothetical protein
MSAPMSNAIETFDLTRRFGSTDARSRGGQLGIDGVQRAPPK